MGAADRAGWFSTELFERYQRSEWALVAAPAEMYVQGVSTRKVATHAGVRESRLIGLMVYDFARIGAAWHTVEDVYKQNRRLWVRLREKDGKRHAMPCHHNFEEYLVGYPDGAGLRGDPKGRYSARSAAATGKLTRTVLPQANAYSMIRRPHGRRRYRHQARQP